MTVQRLYQKKLGTPEDAADLIHNGDFIIVPTGVAEPPTLLTALSEQRRRFHDVKVAQILAIRKFGYLDPETVDHVRHVAFFYGAVTRAGGKNGWIDFTPSYFSEMPGLIERGLIPADVVFSMASPMDENGYFSLSLGADYTMAAVAKARVVVLEVNPNVPFAFGNCHIHISQVTALVESSEPVLEVGLPTIGPVQEAIGKYVADMIEDGSTLQIGYGGIPDAVVMQLTRKHDLGVHTEMIGDGILTLIDSGAVTNRKKTYLPGKMVATFALGSKRLYQLMERNPALEIHPVDFTNDPYLASKNDNLVAINATLQIDLLGQCGSESLGPVPYSGTGGQSDFVRAANPCQHQQKRHQLRGHRIWGGPVAWQIGRAACARNDRHCTPQLPHRTHRSRPAHESAVTKVCAASPPVCRLNFLQLYSPSRHHDFCHRRRRLYRHPHVR
jgi:acyl-CoA hydrolase